MNNSIMIAFTREVTAAAGEASAAAVSVSARAACGVRAGGLRRR